MGTAAVTYTFSANTLVKSSEANTNFQDLVDFVNTNLIQKDASVAFTATPSGPATDPTGDNQFARKAYVDASLDDVLQGLGTYSPGMSGTPGDTARFKFTGGRQTVVFAAGVGTITFPAAFANGLLVCLAQAGDSGDDNSFLLVPGASKTGATVWAVRAGANFAGSMAVNYLAVGW